MVYCEVTMAETLVLLLYIYIYRSIASYIGLQRLYFYRVVAPPLSTCTKDQSATVSRGAGANGIILA
jgi:hypothetical protein